MKIKVKDLKPALTAIQLIAGFPLSIHFAWASATFRRRLEEAVEIQDELERKMFSKYATGMQNGEPAIESKQDFELYVAELRDARDHEVELPELGLTSQQLKEFLSKKKDAEHSATIIHGLLPLLED